MNTIPRYPRMKTLVAAFLLGAAGTLPTMAQPPALILFDGAGGTPGATEPGYVRTNWNRAVRPIKGLPFDGMSMQTNEGNWFMSGDPAYNYSLTNFRAALAPVNYDPNTNPGAPDFTNSTFRNNYAYFRIHRPGLSSAGANGDFFDTSGTWEAFYTRMENFAHAVAEVKDPSGNYVYKGLLLDNEDYGVSPAIHKIFNWGDGSSFWYKANNDPLTGGTHDINDYVIKARSRFKAMYDHIQIGWAAGRGGVKDCIVVTGHSPHDYGILIWRNFGSAGWRSNAELLTTPGMGFFEGHLAGYGGVLIEGGEMYWATTWNQDPTPPALRIPQSFETFYKYSLYSFPLGNDPYAPAFPGSPLVYQSRLLDPAQKASYPGHVLQAFLADDREYGEPADHTVASHGAIGAVNLERHLAFALRRCDTAVFLYAQAYDFLSDTPYDWGVGDWRNQPIAPQAILDAIAAARDSVSTGNMARTSGKEWLFEQFNTTPAWTPVPTGNWTNPQPSGTYQKNDTALGHSSVNDSALVSVQVYYPDNTLQNTQDLALDSKLTWTDYVVQGKVNLTSSAGNGMIGLLGRYQSSSNFYAFRLIDVSGTKKWDLSKVVSGVWTKLQDGTNFPGGVPWAVGTPYTLKMSFDGPAIICSISSDAGVNWTAAASISSDYTFLSGKVGVIGENGVCAFDDIKVNYQGASLVGQWKLDNDATDSSGNGNNGTLSGGPTWVAGQIGNGLNFDGVDDLVNAGNGASLANLPALTATAWIKADTMGGGGFGRIVQKGTGPMGGWRFTVQNNQLNFIMDYTGTGSVDLLRLSATSVIATGVWKHVAVTWTGAATATDIHFYVDGAEVGYSTTTNGVGTQATDSTSSLIIGNESGGTRGFDGVLDDVRVYNYALSAADITALYQAWAGSNPPAAPSGLGLSVVSYSQINLTWTDNSNNETDFRVERKKGSGGTYSEIGTAAAGATSYNDTTAGAGTTYYYRVRAHNATGYSAYCTEANATTTEITSGRQGHWKLDNNATDSSGNGNNGTLSGGPIWVAGKIDNGLTFDGVDDLVNAGSGASLDDLPALTATAWIKADTMGGGGFGRIVQKGAGPMGGWRFTVQTNQLNFIMDYTGTGSVDLQRVSATGVIATGVWKHVAVTWTGSATATNVHFYVDGVEVGYSTTTNGVGTRASESTSNLNIGNESGGTRGFDGILDDARVYNRVLTAAEIAAIYRAGL